MTSPKPEPLPMTDEGIEAVRHMLARGMYKDDLSVVRLLATISHHKARADKAERQLELRQAAHFSMINELAEQWGAKVLSAEARAEAAERDRDQWTRTAFNEQQTHAQEKARADALAAQNLITEGALEIAQAELGRAIESNVALAAQVAELRANQRTPGTVEVCRECREPLDDPGVPNCLNHKWAKVAELTKPQDSNVENDE